MKFWKCKKCGGEVNQYLTVRNGEGSIVYICKKCDTASEKLEEIAERDKKAEEEWNKILDEF